MTADPRIYLAIDNCFASKRWTKPLDWMLLIRDMGLAFVEASADTECDPLYMGADFTRDWIKEVLACSEKTGVAVKNVYSGHGTYATLGLTHTDARVRVRFRDEWMKKQTDTAAALHAGLGFFAHGFDESVLQGGCGAYARYLGILADSLAELAGYAAGKGVKYIGVEQMYSPHQPPWTIAGAEALLKSVYAKAGRPFYLTLDLGHMNGQQYFQRPDKDDVVHKLRRLKSGERPSRVWLGTKKAYESYLSAGRNEIDEGAAARLILDEIEANPQLFADPVDCSVYAWVRSLARYSPIIHLQQSDGKSSAHWPFSEAYNDKGIIKAEEVLASVIAAYEEPVVCPSMPPVCDELALTLEPFIGTAGNSYDAIEAIAESVRYWRRFIPRDGMRLSQISALLNKNKYKYWR